MGLSDAVLDKKFLCAGVALFLKMSSLKLAHPVSRSGEFWLALGMSVKGACPRWTGSAGRRNFTLKLKRPQQE